MPEITMYSTSTCPYCVQAQLLLDRKGVEVNKVMIDQLPQEFEQMIARKSAGNSKRPAAHRYPIV